MAQELLSLDDLKLVRAVGTAGSLTGAARQLALDHSTAFRRLNAAEQRLGARLFERARDGYTPTPAGELALATAARLLDDLTELERRVAGEDVHPSGPVRVTTPDTLAALLGGIFVDLRAHRPAIVIELIVANSFLALRKRDADIAVRPARTAPDALTGRQVANVATAFYAAPSRLDRDLPLAQHAWIGFAESLRHLPSAKWIGANVPPQRIVYRADSLLAVTAAARAGMGVAALPCYLGDADPQLRRVQEPCRELDVPLWLLTHPDLKRVARIRAVLDFLAQRITERRALIEGRTRAPSDQATSRSQGVAGSGERRSRAR
jgi:DNA-binding transcriptional LysR family regulator